MKSILILLGLVVCMHATTATEISQKKALASTHDYMKKDNSLTRDTKKGNTMTKEEIALEQEISIKSGKTINEDLQPLDLNSKGGK